MGALSGQYALSWWYISNGSGSSGANISACYVQGIYSSNSRLTMKIRNTASSKAVLHCYVALNRFDWV